MKNKASILKDYSVRHVSQFADERLVPELVPWHQKQMIRDHVRRYEFARSRLSGGRVLDAACGSGYGSLFLAQAASRVDGVDISIETIEYAKKRYPANNIMYHMADVSILPFKESVFDEIVSFETLEHIGDQKQFISEMVRVLKPGGLFIVSTPNILVNGGELNPFHQKELSFLDFNRLMETHFKECVYFGQKPMHRGYLRFAVWLTNRLPKGRIRWLVDSALKMCFRGDEVKALETFRFGFVPAFFIAVGKKG